MTYMDHVRAVALAGVVIIVEKTRSYGPSWKRRGSQGAWFTTVRPLDRLETLMGEGGFDGDIFGAIAADPEGKDGSVLACIRDLRNYFTLIEAEMVARGVVALAEEEEPVEIEDFSLTDERPLEDRILGKFREWFPKEAIRSLYVSGLDHSDMTYGITIKMGLPPNLPAVPASATMKRVMERQAEQFNEPQPHGYVDQDAGDVPQDTQASAGRLGAGPVSEGCYTTLDLGQSGQLWAEDFGAVPSGGFRVRGMFMGERIGQLRDAALLLSQRGEALVATRLLEPSGDLQILIRIPKAD